ncbi:MAG: DegT/DnrJ/EryC1/StrS aminotransferase family protein [Candidatus Diapherotrites archaeon]
MSTLEKPTHEGQKPVREKYLVFGEPDIQNEEIEETVKTLKSKWIGSGPKVKLFEKKFEEYTRQGFARAVNSCTAALHLSMIASGIKLGDEVIVPSFTFAATANVITHAGGIPIFCDIDRETCNVSAKTIREKITDKTKAIVPVHMYGRPCPMDEITKLAEEHSLMVIEDAAHAIGAEYHNNKIGSISPYTCFSFYVTKNVVTAEGGMVTTNNKKAAEDIEKFALHGLSKGAWERFTDKGYKHYEVIYPGFKYNMTDIQASMGIPQLARIEENLEKRQKMWKKYDSEFEDLPLKTPALEEPKTRHARHLYTIELELEKLKISRDEFMQALHKENIGTGVHYIALHLHKYYRERFGFKENDFPNSYDISKRTLSLPFSSGLTEKDQEDVINAVKKIAKFYKK